MARRVVAAIAVAVGISGGLVGAQEYLIRTPGEATSTPTHLTRPVEGGVEVTNLPEVQGVRIIGGTLEGPVEVRGEVEVRASAPLAVEVVNPVPFPERLEVSGTVWVEDAVPVRVRVENLPRSPPAKRFVSYVFRGEVAPKESRLRRTFQVPAGPPFQLTDLALDARTDAVLKVRLLAPASAVGGSVVGAGDGEVPLVVLLSSQTTAVRVGTPVPLQGGFSVEVEALGARAVAPFSVLASGHVEDLR